MQAFDAAAAVGNSSLLSRLQPPGWRYPLNLLSLAVTGGPARVGPLAWTVAGAVRMGISPAAPGVARYVCPFRTVVNVGAGEGAVESMGT